MADQDLSSSVPFAVVDKHLSMLRLDNPSSAALKRPSSPPSHQPSAKKEKLSPPLFFSGFSKITSLPALPKSQPMTRILTQAHRRCISDPTISSPPGPDSNLPQSPQNDVVVPNSAVAAAATSPPFVVSTRPPRPTLHRCVSDPASSPPPKSVSRTSSSSGDGDDDCTPNTKRRLRRIKDRFREMTTWFEQVMLEDDEEEEGQIINTEPTDELVQDLDNTAAVTKEDCDQKRFEESVSVENVGQCTVIHFSCHCGVPYQFLLAGGNCYCKLM